MIVSSPKIKLVEKDEIKNNEEKFAETFNTFFANIVPNIRILLYQDTHFVGRVDLVVGDDPIFYILVK